MRELERIGKLGYTCPSVFDMLCTPAQYDTIHAAISDRWVDLTVVACDPGVQSGYVFAVRARGVVTPLFGLVLGRRSVAKSRTMAMEPARAPAWRDHAAVLGAISSFCDEEMPQPVIVTEDWFAGPNPGTARDIAQQYYFVEAAADSLGLTFRSVAHSTWKKSYLGRGNMKSADALAAYAARGYAAHAIERWAGAAPALADDSAALGVAHWWMQTEAT